MREAALLNAEAIDWQAGGRRILQAVSLQLKRGEILGVIGPNGAGKSSLLRILARVREPRAGRLTFDGRDYREVPVREFATRLGYLEQNAQVHWPLLARKVIELGRLPYRGLFRSLTPADQEAINAAVALTGVAPLCERIVTTLSEGEKMLVCLTRLLAARPEVIIADEPVAALDPYHQLLIMETLRSLVARGEGFSAIIVLHDLSLAARFCDRLVLLSGGRVAAQGEPRQVLCAENLRRHYRIGAELTFEASRLTITPTHRVSGEG